MGLSCSRANGATLATGNSNTAEAPLVPHIATVTAGVPFTVATYPTVSSAAPGVVTVTVIVSWKPPTGGTDRVVGETEISRHDRPTLGPTHLPQEELPRVAPLDPGAPRVPRNGDHE